MELHFNTLFMLAAVSVASRHGACIIMYFFFYFFDILIEFKTYICFGLSRYLQLLFIIFRQESSAQQPCILPEIRLLRCDEPQKALFLFVMTSLLAVVARIISEVIDT